MMSRGRRPRWVGNDTRVEVLPPLDADGYDEQDNFAAVRPAAPGLSDESVSRILELVWRDTRKVASEYRLGDVSRTVGLFLRGERTRAAETPLFADLVKDRLPILRWYLCHKRDQAAVCLSECLERSHISPSSASDLQLWRARLQAGLEEQKTELWPTLRSLLLTESMHRRVVKAAQTQIMLATGRRTEGSAGFVGQILRSPRRLARLWLAGVKALHYGLRWVFNEFGLKWILSHRQRQRVRTKLIERAILKGLELQRRVEEIEAQQAQVQQAQAAQVQAPPLLLLRGSEPGMRDEAEHQQAALEAAKIASALQSALRGA